MIVAMRYAAALTALLATATLASAETHKFKPTAGVATFTARPPVLTVKPGDTVETETFSKPGDYYDPKVAGPWPGEVGPFLIEGAAPGDTLSCGS
jgi:acetamidase/formamidase